MISTELSLIADLKLRKDLLEWQYRVEQHISETTRRIRRTQWELIAETDWRETDLTLDRVFQAAYGKTQAEIMGSASEVVTKINSEGAGS